MAGVAFEVRRFVLGVASDDVALLELEGRFLADAPRQLGTPRLIVDSDDGPIEVPSIGQEEAVAGPEGATWRASFALPLTVASGSSFALKVRRLALVELPLPDAPADDDGAAERLVRLAREANTQRHRAEAAYEALAAGEAAHAQQFHELREQHARELGAAHAEHATAAEAAEERRTREQAEADEQHARALAANLEQHARDQAAAEEQHAHAFAAGQEERARELADAAAEHVRALAALQDQHAAELIRAQEEQAHARRALRELRSELESSRHDRERSEPATRPHARPASQRPPDPRREPDDEDDDHEDELPTSQAIAWSPVVHRSSTVGAWLARALALIALVAVLLALYVLVKSA